MALSILNTVNVPPPEVLPSRMTVIRKPSRLAATRYSQGMTLSSFNTVNVPSAWVQQKANQQRVVGRQLGPMGSRHLAPPKLFISEVFIKSKTRRQDFVDLLTIPRSWRWPTGCSQGMAISSFNTVNVPSHNEVTNFHAETSSGWSVRCFAKNLFIKPCPFHRQ